MNRIIKFRAWNKYNKEMLDVEKLDFEELYKENPYIRTTTYTDYFNSDEMILMQFTGLHDRKGNEIYEEDIVRVESDKAIVEWSNDYSGFILKPVEDYYFDSAMVAHNLDIIDSIIGNIYENKNLIEED